MKDEISAAATFLARIIEKNGDLNEKQVETFNTALHAILMERFKDHWFPEKPFKGQAYRCIRVNEIGRKDPILEEAAQRCGLEYEDLKLPIELTVWVDPLEVCCRFGEHKGSYCTVASFKNGNKENFVDTIKVEEFQQKTAVIIKKGSQEVFKKKKSSKHSNPRKNGYNQSFISSQSSPQTILQQLSLLSHPQNFSSPMYQLNRALSYQRNSRVPQNFNFGTVPSLHGIRPNSYVVRGKQYNNSHPLHHSAKYLGNFKSSMSPLSNIPNNMRYAMSSKAKNDKYHWSNKTGAKE